MENIIEVKNLTKKYKNLKAVDDLSFEVKKGEILGLLGPNGSGKSTTINCLLSLLNYQNGSIKIFGEEMTPTSYEIKKQIGVIFQEIAVFEELTVYENIDYFCGLYISDKSLKRVLEKCEFYKVKYLEIDDSTFVSKLLNKKIVKLISINDKGFAKSLKEKGGIEDGKK